LKILGIETSTETGSLALLEGGETRARAEIDTHERHSARIIPILDRLLAEAGWTVDELEAVGAGLGPGSFTGIRVGLAVARGLSFALKIPLKGVSSFEALARGTEGEGRIAAGGSILPSMKNGETARSPSAPRPAWPRRRRRG